MMSKKPLNVTEMVLGLFGVASILYGAYLIWTPLLFVSAGCLALTFAAASVDYRK